ncbi:MAG: PKD domain-containing protein [Opitutales bacterium]|nr:PKD domain-containing protein [Opitutales bacterium]
MVRLENNNWKLDDVEHLDQLTYFSGGRLYWAEGDCVREHFQEFFPEVDDVGSDFVAYSPASIGASNLPDEVITLSSGKLSQKTMDKFEERILAFEEIKKSGASSFNQEAAFAEFTLPDPRKCPDLYVVMSGENNSGLAVFWGLQVTEPPQANIKPLEVLEILKSEFVESKSKSKPAIPVPPKAPSRAAPPPPPPAAVLQSKPKTPSIDPEVVPAASDDIPATDDSPVSETPEPKPSEQLTPQTELEPVPAPEPTPIGQAGSIASIFKSLEPYKEEFAAREQQAREAMEKARIAAEKEQAAKSRKVSFISPKSASKAATSKTEEIKPVESKPSETLAPESKQPDSAVSKTKPPTTPKPEKTKPVVVKPPKPPKPPVDRTKQIRMAKQIGIGLAALIVVMLVLRISAASYLGPKVVVTPRLDPNAQTSEVPFEPDEIIELAQFNERWEMTQSGKASITHFPKPGKYSINRLRANTLGNGEPVLVSEHSVLFDNVNHSDVFSPVANLILPTKNVAVSQEVSAIAGASFARGNRAELVYLGIDWGDESWKGFQGIAESSGPVTHAYSQPGQYRVSLIVKDQNGRWDVDSEFINVFPDGQIPTSESVLGQMTPLPMAVIRAVRTGETENTVHLWVGDSIDLDGTIEQITVDWGDSKPEQSVIPAKGEINHAYPKSAGNRFTITVSATDNDGNVSKQPAEVVVDFQNTTFPSPDPKKGRMSLINTISWHASPDLDNPDSVRVRASSYSELTKARKTMVFDLYNPLSQPMAPLSSINWKITDPSGTTHTVTGVRTVELAGEKGKYSVQVSASLPGQEPQNISFSTSIDTKGEMKGMSGFFNWIASTIPDLGLSKLVQGKE